MSRWQFWIDRGGTFTDVVGRRPDGRLETLKLLSEAPGRYPDAALEGMRRLLGAAPGEPFPADRVECLRMGTTVGTNALLTRSGAPTCLAVTRGFADLLAIGYQNRPDIFALEIRLPAPLYQRVLEVDERLAADGTVLAAPDPERLLAELAAARAAGCTSLAVLLLHAYRHPVHEQLVEALARRAGFAHVSCSHQVAPVIRAVSRGQTTVADAYLTPVVRRYVEQVTGATGDARVLFMQSSGSLVEAAGFRGRDSLLSGPAGGIVGAVKACAEAGIGRLVGFDMGGTSTDVAHYAGAWERRFEAELAGVRLAVPMLHIHTVAAGGGSILHYEGGRCRVGPDSAGADPGPACYRRGGPLTVTDCNLLLGRIQPDFFPRVFGPAGDEALDPDAVAAGFAALAARMAGDGPAPDPRRVAEGFLTVAVENMANAIHQVSVARGLDLDGHALCCFGGAGGQHACRVAERLGIRQVFVHPLAGVLSAYGIGLAEEGAVTEASVEEPLDEALAARLAGRARALAGAARLDGPGLRVAARARIKYQGSDTPLEVELADAAAMASAFESAHRLRYGFASPGRGLVVASLVVEVARPGDAPPALAAPAPGGRPAGHAGLWCGGALAQVPVWRRDDLPQDQELAGPLLVVDALQTLVVDPGWTVVRNARGHLLLAHRARPPRAPVDGRRDPVLLEVFANRFMAIATEMGEALRASAVSVNIRERLDFSCAVFDAAGQLVANAPHIPVHLGSMGECVEAVIGRFGAYFRPGDAVLLNSPYHGGTHLPDITVVSPVFAPGEAAPAFYVASRGHHADVGGVSPGSMPPGSTRIEEEGALSEGLLIARDGEFRAEAVRAWLLAGPWPARNPDQNLADLAAQLAANRRGAEGLLGLAAEFSPRVVAAYMGHVMDQAEEAVRAVIDRLSDGRFRVESDQGAVICLEVRVDRAARAAVLDFSGTSAQRPDNFNAPLAVARAAALYVFRTLVATPLPLNAGCLRPLELRVPEGSLLRPRPPAAVVAGNVETSQLVVDALYGALRVMAASQGTMNNLTFGDARHQYYETLCGGTGAGPGFAGADAVHSHMTNSRLTDPEVLEWRYPVRLEYFRVRRGSGGRGRWRGGDGVVRGLRFLAPMSAGILSGRRRRAPFGLAGGGDGAPGANRLLRAGGGAEDLAPSVSLELAPGDLLEISTPGGGAYGEPEASP